MTWQFPITVFSTAVIVNVMCCEWYENIQAIIWLIAEKCQICLQFFHGVCSWLKIPKVDLSVHGDAAFFRYLPKKSIHSGQSKWTVESHNAPGKVFPAVLKKNMSAPSQSIFSASMISGVQFKLSCEPLQSHLQLKGQKTVYKYTYLGHYEINWNKTA